MKYKQVREKESKKSMKNLFFLVNSLSHITRTDLSFDTQFCTFSH